jgi:CubicO group peptidase (beta-lactamase class C family)
MGPCPFLSSPGTSRRSFGAGLAAAALVGLSGLARAAPRPGEVLDAARALGQLHSLVVTIGGETRLAEAVRGPAVDHPVNIKSVSKTVIAALTGIAIDQGVIEGVDQPVVEILGESVPDGADPRVRETRIGHLLTMQAGLERTSGPNYGRWVQSDNWVRYALSRPFVDEPGGRFLYSTGSFHLLSAALTEAAGRSTLDLARDWLGDPLSITIPPWTRDPQGIYMGGNNMALSPLAMTRLGETYRLGGRFDGKRVLPAEWVVESWTPRTRSPFSGDQYGYGWFITRMAGYDVRYARGYGGQMIYVVPALGLTAAVTSDTSQPARSGGYVGVLHRLLTEQIIPLAEAA